MASSDMIQTTIRPPVSKLKKDHDERVRKLKSENGGFAKVSVFLDRWVQQNFKTEGGNVGGWAPLAAGGRWVKGQGLDPTAKILQDTGRLRTSFKPFTSMFNAGIGSDLPYSIKHNKGEDGLPVRRMLPKRKEVIGDARKILDSHVERSIK